MRNQSLYQADGEGLMLTREAVIDLILDNLKEKAPEAIVKQAQDDFHYEVDLGTGAAMHLYLGNAWDNYQRSKNPQVLVDFIDVQIELFAYMNKLDKGGVDVDKVFPVLRQASFDVSAGVKDKVEDKSVLKDAFSSELSVLYVQDHPKFVSFLVEKQLPENYTSDMMVEKAFENLKEQGWVEPVHTIPLGLATVYFFHESDKQYQAQFMVKEMYEPHLSDYFLLALPTRDISIVVAFHDEPDAHLEESKEIARTLQMQAFQMFRNEQNPLTPKLHRVTDGDIKLLA